MKGSFYLEAVGTIIIDCGVIWVGLDFMTFERKQETIAIRAPL